MKRLRLVFVVSPVFKLAGVAWVIVFALGANSIGAATQATRDWTKHPAVVQVDTTEDIFAVGDPHADYDRLVGLLVTAKIMGGVPAASQQPVWAAGKSVVENPIQLLNAFRF